MSLSHPSKRVDVRQLQHHSSQRVSPIPLGQQWLTLMGDEQVCRPWPAGSPWWEIYKSERGLNFIWCTGWKSDHPTLTLIFLLFSVPPSFTLSLIFMPVLPAPLSWKPLVSLSFCHESMLSKRIFVLCSLCLSNGCYKSAKTVGTVEHLSLEIQMQPTLPETPSNFVLLSEILKRERKRRACISLFWLCNVSMLSRTIWSIYSPPDWGGGERF